MASALKPIKKDSILLAALPYVFSVIVGLLVYLIEKEDRYVRFHALQGILFHFALGIAYAAIVVIFLVFAFATMGLGMFCFPAIWLLGFATLGLNIWLAYRAYQGEYFELPVIGEFAARHV